MLEDEFEHLLLCIAHDTVGCGLHVAMPGW
jgi:hypothetical protein